MRGKPSKKSIASSNVLQGVTGKNSAVEPYGSEYSKKSSVKVSKESAP